MTESEMAIKKALHELEVQRGNGVFDIPALRRILETGLVTVIDRTGTDRTVKRPVAQATELLDLDDNGGH